MKLINIPRLLLASLIVTLPTPAIAKTQVTVSNGRFNAPLVIYGTYGMLAEDTITINAKTVETSFDYDAFFTKLRATGRGQKPINAVRVWGLYHWSNALTPFSGLPRYDGDSNRKQRYDFSYNPAFFKRLNDFVAKADAKGIVVQICLFDACGLKATALRWENNPYNRDNNRDARALTATNRKNFYSTSGPIWDINAGLIDKIVSTVGNYSNVIYEVMNEPTNSATGVNDESILAFHKAAVARLRKDLSPKSGSKLISVNADSAILKSWAKDGGSGVDILSFHLVYNDNAATKDFTQYLMTKPVIISNDGHRSCDANLDSATRRSDATNLVRRVFAAAGSNAGRLNLEFLDNSLVAGYATADYDPRANRVNDTLLNILKSR